MTKKNTSENTWRVEHKILVALSFLFVAVVTVGWLYSVHIRKDIVTTNSAIQIDTSAFVQIEKIRNLMESFVSNSRSYFLLNSSNLYDLQKKNKEAFRKGLDAFKQQYGLPTISELVGQLNAFADQEQEIFEQGLKFRDQKTESKIIGQFYQSKASILKNQMEEVLEKIEQVHKNELKNIKEAADARTQESTMVPNVLIPRAMVIFISALMLLFAGLGYLIVNLLAQQKRQIAERTRLYEEAQNAIKSRDEVITAVSYDFNEPLKEIKNLTKKLKSEEAEQINNQVSAIDDSLKNIYDQAKADTGNMALRLDQLNVDELLDDARLMLQGPAKQRDVRLMFDSGSPHTLAFFDRERVMRVLSNLVGNAVKFSPKNGKVMVSVRSDQQFVHISVEDNGPGIPDSKLAGIFDNFWQTPSTSEQGAGVGLAIVKTIIEAHGGTVKAISKVGMGSTFTFSLPRRRPVGAQINRPAVDAKLKKVDFKEPGALV